MNSEMKDRAAKERLTKAASNSTAATTSAAATNPGKEVHSAGSLDWKRSLGFLVSMIVMAFDFGVSLL